MTNAYIDFVISLKPSRFDRPGWMEGDSIELRTATGYRYSLLYVDATGESRREYMGPILPGPYATPVGLPTVIALHHTIGPTTVIEVIDGDVLDFHGHTVIAHVDSWGRLTFTN